VRALAGPQKPESGRILTKFYRLLSG